MKSLLPVAICLCIAASAHGILVSADADGYANGTDISTAFTGITLSSVGGYTGLDGVVYALGDALASTGTNVFANNLSFQRQWYAGLDEGFAFRADFDQTAVSVSIDIIGDDTGDYGELCAYNSAGILVGYVLSPQLSVGEIFSAAIDRDWAYDIAYIIAGGAAAYEDTVHLDNLIADVIPEPATLCLLGLGSLILTMKRRKINYL